MTTTGDLFDDLEPPRFGRDTDEPRNTKRAAKAAIDEHVPALRRRVLDCLRTFGDEGATDEQMQEALRMKPQTQTPRRLELVQQNLVRDSGRRRRLKSGNSGKVWVAVH